MTDATTIEVREPGRVPLRLVVTDRLPIGRAGDGLLLTDAAISRHHCELRATDGALEVRDLGSSNGTTVNGVAVTAPRRLAVGDVVRFGGVEVVVGPGSAEPDPMLVATVVGAAAAGAPAAGRGDPTASYDVPPAALLTDDLRGSIALVAAEVLARPAPPAAPVPAGSGAGSGAVGGTVTMVFSDIVDSTALTERLGDQRWYEVLVAHNAIVRDALARHDGTEVKSVGDGFLLTFPSARQGVQFAVAAQRALAERRAADPAFPVHVRIGVHTGEAVREGADLFGRHVNYAARVSSHAAGDEIVASSLTRELAAAMGDLAFGAPRRVALKGFDGEHAVHPVAWR